VEARTDPDFVIIARTDARNAKSFGGDQASREAFDEGVRRLKAAMEAGADIAFMESPRTKEEMQILVKELAPHPVLINVLPNVSSDYRPANRYKGADKDVGTDRKLDDGRVQRIGLCCRHLSLHRVHPVHAGHARILSGVEGRGLRFEVLQG